MLDKTKKQVLENWLAKYNKFWNLYEENKNKEEINKANKDLDNYKNEVIDSKITYDEYYDFMVEHIGHDSANLSWYDIEEEREYQEEERKEK